MEAKADNTVPYAAGGNTLDLSSQLEKQLTEQFTEERELAAALEKVSETTVQKEAAPINPEEAKPVSPQNPQKPVKTSGKGKTVSLVKESKYLRYLSELRKADSELALARAESAELVRQMDNYRGHYQEYEEIIQKLISDQDQSVTEKIHTLQGLSLSIQQNSESLSNRIDAEIQRLTQSLAHSIETDIKNSCDQELSKVEEATKVLYDYSEKVKEQYVRFQKLERVKFALFILSSISSPIVLILLILNMLHIL